MVNTEVIKMVDKVVFKVDVLVVVKEVVIVDVLVVIKAVVTVFLL